MKELKFGSHVLNRSIYERGWRVLRNEIALLVVAVLMLFLVGCGNEATQVEATATPIPLAERPRNPTYEVARGEVVDQVQFSARVAPVLEEKLFFRTDGRIREIFVERDDQATAGQLLADMEQVEALERQLSADELALRRAQITLSMAELALEMANAQAAFADDDIELAEANLAAAMARLEMAEGAEASTGNLLTMGQIGLEQAQSNLDDAQNAYDTAWDPGRDWELDIDYRKEELKNERDNTSRQLEQAKRDLRAEQANYNLTAGGLSNDDSMSAQAALISARLALAQAQASFSDYDVRQKAFELELATIAFEEAQLGKEDLEALIADAQIIAPFDGQILLVSASEGRILDAYDSVMIIAAMEELELSAGLTLQQLDGLVEGMPVSIELVDRPGETIGGSIRRVPYLGGRTGGGVEEEDTSTRITLDVPIEEAGLKVKDLTKVTVVIERKDDVLWLPPQAIRKFEGRSFVVVQDGEIQRRVDVNIGLEGDGRVEIEEGLQEGQIVVAP
jgi:multidrug efflux pump subunit AcrA (membrane-fusion protein)